MKSEFLSLCDPRAFWRKADKARSKLGAERFFNQPGISWLREAWTIGRFGLLVEAQSVALFEPDPPDALLVKDGRTFRFEIVEALKPGRRRGKEYRERRPEPTFVEEEDNWINEQDLKIWVEAAVEKKLRHRYAISGSWDVLVHIGGLYMFTDNKKLYRLLQPMIEDYAKSADLCVCVLRGRAAFGPSKIVPSGGYIEFDDI
jgi:hypothetical protein